MLTLEQQDAQADLQHQEEGEPTPKANPCLREEAAVHRSRNLLPAKVQANSIGSLYYRADYELRWLRVARRARVAWLDEFKSSQESRDIATMALASRHLLDWCERERAILRISKPAASTPKEPKTVHRLDRDQTVTVQEVAAKD